MKSLFPSDRPWPVWQLFLFRLIFIFFLLMMNPVDVFFRLLKWAGIFYENYDLVRTRIVTWANDHFFHISPSLVQPVGTGDTSLAWANLCLVVCITAPGAVIWSIADRRRTHYRQLGYWFRNYLRYYLIMTAAIYGLLKIMLIQMGSLNLIALSTEVGDLSPMRLCWYFMAASPSYQIFSGVMELMVALLLLYRRTVTPGLLLGLAVFTNVMLLNFSYDIPVKMLSAELVLTVIVLLFRDYERLISFLVLNKPAARSELYDPGFRTMNFRTLRLFLKGAFLFVIISVPFLRLMSDRSNQDNAAAGASVPAGVYDISRFSRNGDSSTSQQKIWKRIVFDRNGTGMLQGDSTLFLYIYGQSMFEYKPAAGEVETLEMEGRKSKDPRSSSDSVFLHYQVISPGMIRFIAKTASDSLRFEAKLSSHTYRLATREFHWISEYVP